jgi:hypothetical protein
MGVFMRKILWILTILALFSAVSEATLNYFSNSYAGISVSQNFILTFSEDSDRKTSESIKFDAFLGYRFNPNLRWDLQYSIINAVLIQNDYEYRANAIFANIYLDLWDMERSLLTPFIGLGAGLASPAIMSPDQEWRTSALAWQLHLGFHTNLFELFVISIRYALIGMPPIENVIENRNINSYIQSVGVGLFLLI